MQTDPITQMLADAIALAVTRPEVIEAVRAMYAPPVAVDSGDLVSKTALARALGVSPATVDRHDRAGAPYEQVGSRKRYDVAARRVWLAKRGRFAVVTTKSDDDIDIDDVTSSNGLRVVVSR